MIMFFKRTYADWGSLPPGVDSHVCRVDEILIGNVGSWFEW